MSQILAFQGSLMETPCAEAFQLYHCTDHTFEDPPNLIQTRHLIGLTTNHAYKMVVAHDQSQRRDITYAPEEFFIWSAGSRHWSRWWKCDAILVSIDSQYFSRKTAQALGGGVGFLNSQLKQRDDLVSNLIHRMYQVASQDDPDSKLYFESLSIALMVHLAHRWGKRSAQRRVAGNGRLSHEAVSRIELYVEEYLSQRIAISDLAGLLSMSEFHFMRMFKETTNQTAYQYILMKRLDRAFKLVTRTYTPLATIALDTGFSSQSHLSTQFKKRFNRSLRQVRKEHQKSSSFPTDDVGSFP